LASIGYTSYDITGMFLESGDGSGLPSTRDIGGAIIAGMIGKKILKPAYNLCRRNRSARRYCNYALGYVGAELAIEALLLTTRYSWAKNKGITTVVGAFDLASGNSAAAYNLGKRKPRPLTHGSLTGALNKVGACTGVSDPSIFGSTFKFGNCAEFLAANKLMFRRARKKAIRWTKAYGIDDHGTTAGRGPMKNYCSNCVGIFNLRN